MVPCTDSVPEIVVLPVTANVEFSIHAPSTCSSRVHVTSRPCKSPVAVTLAINSAEVALTTALLDPQVMLPLLSTDGAVTWQLNVALLLVALLLVSPSRSTLFESANHSVGPDGFSSDQVSSDSCSVDDELSRLVFAAGGLQAGLTAGAISTNPAAYIPQDGLAIAQISELRGQLLQKHQLITSAAPLSQSLVNGLSSDLNSKATTA